MGMHTNAEPAVWEKAQTLKEGPGILWDVCKGAVENRGCVEGGRGQKVGGDSEESQVRNSKATDAAACSVQQGKTGRKTPGLGGRLVSGNR